MKFFTSVIVLCCINLLVCAQNRNLDSLQNSLQTDNVRDKIKTLLELCWEYRFSNADTARYYGLEALRMAQEAKIEELEVEALSHIGVTHEAQGNYAKALDFQFKAIDLRKKLGDDSKTANTLNNIGIIYDEKGDFQKAVEYYLNALRIYERLKDKGKIAMVLTNMGIVMREQKDFQKSANNYRNALTIYQQLGNQFGVAACHANLGAVYMNLRNYDSALHFSLLATKEFEEQNIQQFLPSTLSNAAVAYDTLGKIDKALEFLLRAKALHEQYDNKKELSFVQIQLGRLYSRTGKTELGLSYAQNGLALAEKIQALEQIMQAHLALAEIKATRKDFKAAYLEHQKYVQVKDSLFQQEKSKQLTEMQTKYETEKKEQEINIQKLVINEQNLKLSRTQFLIAGLVLLLIFGLTTFLLWRSRKKLQEQKLAEETQRLHQEELTKAVIQLQEQERSRFAKDLHDGFGQLITALKMQVEKADLRAPGIPEVIQHMHDEIRNVSFALSPQVLVRDGLVQALKELAFRINRSDTVNIVVQTTGLHERLPADYEIALYRVCQEWINNIMKYSKANRAELQIIDHNDEITVMIEDNGQGFDILTLEQSMGNGWKNIQSRIQILKGAVEIDSSPGRSGNTFTANIPKFLNTTAAVA